MEHGQKNLAKFNSFARTENCTSNKNSRELNDQTDSHNYF